MPQSGNDHEFKWLTPRGPTSGGDASFFVTGVDILTQWIEFKRSKPLFI